MKDSIDFEIIWKKVNDTLTEEEQRHFDVWYNASEKHVKYFNKVVSYVKFGSSLNLGAKEIAKAMKRVSFYVYIRPKILKSLKVAAVIIPAILVGAIAATLMQNDKQVEVAETIQAGSSKATLILSDGTYHELEESNKFKIKEKGATIVLDGKALDYNTKESDREVPEKIDEVYMNTLKIPRGGEFTLKLSDGTQIWINSESIVKYPLAFIGNERRISVLGEVYLEVAHNKEKPFIVDANGQEIEVLGTTFNINAYPDQNENYITLCEGSIKVNTSSAHEGYVLEPGLQSVFDKVKHQTTIREVNIERAIAWKNGRYSFVNESLEDMMVILSRWYNFSFRFNDDAKRNIKFTGNLNRRNSFKEILTIIEKTNEIEIKINGKNVIID